MSTQDATQSHAVAAHVDEMVDSFSTSAYGNASRARMSKSGILALVVLGHVVAFYVVAHLPSMITHIMAAEPLQVVMLAEPHRDQPVPQPLPQKFELPVIPINIVEPEININVRTEATPLTVTTNVVEAAPTTNIVAVPKEVLSVEYLREPAAKYPAASRTLKQHGTVILRALIDANGVARDVYVHRSSGYRLLDDAGRIAVLNASFKPYMEDGHALPVYVLIPIEFVRPS